MGKQTMGTPLYAYPYRSDNKLYRIRTPQSPLVRPVAHDQYQIDEYPLGTNAIVAVISYTVRIPDNILYEKLKFIIALPFDNMVNLCHSTEQVSLH